MPRGNRVNLTDRLIERLRPRATKYHVFGIYPPGICITVHPTGDKSICLCKRYPGSPNPKNCSMRVLGRWRPANGEQRLGLTLREGIRKAEDWILDIERGIDPAKAAAAQAEQAAAPDPHLFATLWSMYYDAHGANLAHWRECSRAGRGFVHAWSNHRAEEITAADIAAYIHAITKRVAATKGDGKGHGEARNTFGHLTGFFSWCAGNGLLKTNPCRELSISKILGHGRAVRARTLTDDEIQKVWQACGQLPFGSPSIYGIAIKVLLLTGARLNEIMQGRWSEIDFDKGEWIVPGIRTKMERPLYLPLTPTLIELLRSLPRFVGTDFVFTCNGKNAMNCANKRLRELQALSGTSNWVAHDLRRSMRSRLSAIAGFTDTARELSIGHSKKGMQAVYDQHAYTDELRELFSAWEARLLAIVDGTGDNVVPLRVA
jgi:integrase